MKKILLFALVISGYTQAMEQKYPLHDAAQAGNLAAVINLLENHHYDPNVKDSNDWTLLHCAAWKGHKDILTYLIEQSKYPIDPNLQDKYGETPLHKAAQLGRTNIATCLIQHPKCDPNLQDNDGRTALHKAAERDHQNVAECLINHPKCDPNLQDKFGYTALHIAAERGHQNVAECLINHPKCDPNLQNKFGYTALHKAAEQGHQNVAECLIKDPKCNLNLPDNYGRTALHFAALWRHIAIAKTLLYLGADLSIQDQFHDYPFDDAKAPELKKLLTPSKAEEFRKNPKEYKEKHSFEFDPVDRFPEEFDEFKEPRMINKIKIKEKTNGQNVITYLIKRQFGIK